MTLEQRIAALGKRINKIYQQANKELTKKVDSFFADFEKLDKKKKALVEAGKLSEDEYKKWRKNKLLMGEKYEQLRDNVGQTMLEANKTAAAYINRDIIPSYATGYNFEGSLATDALKNYSFDLIDENAVKRLTTSNETILPYKIVDGRRDVRWNTKKVNSAVLQGILQGESSKKIAKRLMNVTEMNRTSAIRNARTALTGAHNSGRQDAMHKLSEDGVIVQKEWFATTGDSRTRDAHLELHHVIVDEDKPFENSLGRIMFPGDPNANPANTYNCRCAMATVIKGFRKGMEPEPEEPEKEKAFYDEYEPYGERPRMDDYDDYDEFVKARDKWKEEKAEKEKRIEEWYDATFGGHGISDKEFSEWLEKNGIVQHGDLTGLDREALKSYTVRYEQLSKDFPQVKEWHNETGRPFEISYRPDAVWDAEGTFGMAFGPAYSDYKHLVASDFGEAGKYLVRGQNPALRTFDHEFGHQLFSAVRHEGIDLDLVTREMTERRIAMEKDLIETLVGKSGISEYATTNAEELFAEGFSAWYGGEKTDFAVSMGDFLRKWGITK